MASDAVVIVGEGGGEGVLQGIAELLAGIHVSAPGG
jgi:hypothetical protein